MADLEVPAWLRGLSSAPVYRPTETEFADPIAFITSIEREASSFGICKVIPPLPKPSRKFVLENLRRSLSPDPSPDSGAGAAAEPASSAAVFTTRHQELGCKRSKNTAQKKVWQSGEVYTVDQFEAKAKAFARSQLSGVGDANPLVVESLFWKAAGEKPIYVEYANDVPGSGFSPPEAPFSPYSHRKKCKRGLGMPEAVAQIPGIEGTSGWKLSNSPWNLQAIARSPGSVTRFMPDDVPGVTSPMVYLGMLFSWFAWHVEDHELHSLNFLHLGAPKTWYAVPAEYASSLEEVVRVNGYGGQVDRLAAFMMLGEKTTLLSPEVMVESGIPCCRLVQNPGEFVVTFPRAYHIGFSHGFNCGEAANFATLQWLEIAKEAAVRRAAMNHLPMLSHQQLLYLLNMSFISRVPRTLVSGVRSSRLKDRKLEQVLLIKKAFLNDMMAENRALHLLLGEESVFGVVMWEPELLPTSANVSQSSCTASFDGLILAHSENEVSGKGHLIVAYKNVNTDVKMDGSEHNSVTEEMEKVSQEGISYVSSHTTSNSTIEKIICHTDHQKINTQAGEKLEYVEDELPFGMSVESGTLACMACGILGYPFMVVAQPSRRALEKLSFVDHKDSNEKLDKEDLLKRNSEFGIHSEEQKVDESGCFVLRDCHSSVPVTQKQWTESHTWVTKNATKDSDYSPETGRQKVNGNPLETGQQKVNGSQRMSRPHTFCLQHALEILQLRQFKDHAQMHIICHSDYIKIEAAAIALADEIGTRFDLKGFPMSNASPAELESINASIDDENDGGCSDDWASRLGLNLRHFVKARKQSLSSKGPLALSLSGIFSQHTSDLAVPLAWCRKKTRTLTKTIGTTLSSSYTHYNGENNREASRVFDMEPMATTGDSRGRKLLRCNISAGSCDQLGSKVRCKDSEWFGTVLLDERGDPYTSVSDYAEQLVTVPVCAAENVQMCHEYSWATPRLGFAPRGCNIMKPESLVVHVKPVLEEVEALNDRNFSNSMSSLDASAVENSGVGHCADASDYCCNKPAVGNQDGPEHHINLPPKMRKCCKAWQGVRSQGLTGFPLEVYNRALCSSKELLQRKTTDSCEHQSSYEHGKEFDEFGCSVLSEDTDIMVRDPPNCAEECGEVSTLELLIGNTRDPIFRSASATLEANVNDGNPMESGYPVDCSATQTSEAPPEAPLHIVDGEKSIADCPDKLSNALGSPNPGGKSSRYARWGSGRPIIVYRRMRRPKRKLDGEAEPTVSDNPSCILYSRSPCEGLRPRTGKETQTMPATSAVGKVEPKEKKRRRQSSAGHKSGTGESTTAGHECDIDGCHMRFGTKRELDLHEANRCMFKGCGRKFVSHVAAARHQSALSSQRPLVCPWEGCGMSFRWAWARTEHIQLHTGERPYECRVAGCGRTFRFLSDFSRHRRKTGHSGG